MRLKLISRGIAILVTVGGAAMSVNGCATEDSELFIRAVADTPPGQCTLKPEADTQQRGTGVLDLAFGTGYFGSLLFGNQLVARGSSDLVRTEVNRVAIDSADVTVESADGLSIISYSVPTNGFADPTTGGTPGYGLATVPMVDFASARKAYLANKRSVVSRVRLFGKTLGGSKVQTNEFTFIIEICNGCTINYAAGNDDPTQPSPNCLNALTATSTSSSSITTPPCVIGQDYPIDCSTCLASTPACLTGPAAL